MHQENTQSPPEQRSATAECLPHPLTLISLHAALNQGHCHVARTKLHLSDVVSCFTVPSCLGGSTPSSPQHVLTPLT